MGATTLAMKGYIAPLFNIENDKQLLLVSRLTTVVIGAISLLLGFFVKEILREVTWIAVFLSAIVYIVFIGWFGKKIENTYSFVSLIGTVLIVVCSFVFGIYKHVHPIWPVTIFVLIVMGIGALASKKV
jgi:Na+/proline symporter